jgi:translation initiation factor IF-2
MPRHLYWTIIAEGAPTAFRARDRAELMPTLKQLQRKDPGAALKWFERGRLWASPEEARTQLAAERSAARRPPPGWRPGGDHRDPHERHKVPRDVRRRQQMGRWKEETGSTPKPGKDSDWRDRGPAGPRPAGPPRFDGPRPPRPDRPGWRPRSEGPGPGQGTRPPRGEGFKPGPGNRPPRGEGTGPGPGNRPPRFEGPRPPRPDRPGWRPRSEGPGPGQGPRPPRGEGFKPGPGNRRPRFDEGEQKPGSWKPKESVKRPKSGFRKGPSGPPRPKGPGGGKGGPRGPRGRGGK